MKVQIDNSHPKAKLELRRYFLRKYHMESLPKVLDCCMGDGLLWKTLKEEFEIGRYWGLDLKPSPGRLKVDSTRVLAMQGWDADIVDIDTYTAPWDHWLRLLPNLVPPLTVFLTIGEGRQGAGNGLSLGAREALGIHLPHLTPVHAGCVREMAVNYCLTRAYQYGLRITEAAEATYERSGHSATMTRYIGVRLEAN